MNAKEAREIIIQFNSGIRFRGNGSIFSFAQGYLEALEGEEIEALISAGYALDKFIIPCKKPCLNGDNGLPCAVCKFKDAIAAYLEAIKK